MRVIETEDYEAMSLEAASLIAAQIREKPDCVLGLATGSTVIGAYERLQEWHRAGQLCFAGVRTVNLDEYLGLAPEHCQSYHSYMRRRLFDGVDIDPANTFLPDGTAADPWEECRRYDRLLREMGGQDLQLLGLGHNGHIGFNEPGEEFVLPTHVVELAESTVRANSRLFSSVDEVPRRAITMGIGGIMGARRVVVAVSGEDKAEAVELAFAGPVTPRVPASILMLHRDVTLVGDRAALARLPKEMRV